jgi:hypothetical protein
MAEIDMAFFPSVEGSMTSADGKTFMLHVKRPTGGDLMLGFPHSEIPNIVENAAVLTMSVGRARTISFLLPGDMPGQLSDTLQKLAN